MENETNINIEETEEEKQLKTARRGLLIFWLRMVGYLAAGIGGPVTTFAIKFGLFTPSGYTATVDEMGNVTSQAVALNGWGIVSCILIGFTAISILKEVIDAYSNKYSLVKQILVGIKNKILPIAIALAACYFLRGVMDQVVFCLAIIGICQIVAVPLNPLPKWRAEKKGEEDYSDLLSGAVDLLKDFKEFKRTKRGDK